MTYEFPKEWHLINQESHLIQALLANGLTDLRRANLGRKRLFYAGFYNIAISLERLMKCTLIIDHMQANDFTRPSVATLKRHGHDLKTLIGRCHQIASDVGISCNLHFSGKSPEL
jgi:hypothetical protein